MRSSTPFAQMCQWTYRRRYDLVELDLDGVDYVAGRRWFFRGSRPRRLMTDRAVAALLKLHAYA